MRSRHQSPGNLRRNARIVLEQVDVHGSGAALRCLAELSEEEGRDLFPGKAALRRFAESGGEHRFDPGTRDRRRWRNSQHDAGRRAEHVPVRRQRERDGRRVVEAMLERHAARIREEGGQLGRAVTEDGHSERLEQLRGRGKIQDRLRARADDTDAPSRDLSEVAGDVGRLPRVAAAVDAADATGGEDANSHALGDGAGRAHGRTGIALPCTERPQVARSGLCCLSGWIREALQLCLARTNLDRAVDDRHRGRNCAACAHLRAASRLVGGGKPCATTLVSRATTERRLRRAAATSSAISRIIAAPTIAQAPAPDPGRTRCAVLLPRPRPSAPAFPRTLHSRRQGRPARRGTCAGPAPRPARPGRQPTTADRCGLASRSPRAPASARSRWRTPAATARGPRAKPAVVEGPPGEPGIRSGDAAPARPCAGAARLPWPPRLPRPPRGSRSRYRRRPGPPAPARLPGRRPPCPASRPRAAARSAAWWWGAWGSRSEWPRSPPKACVRGARPTGGRWGRRFGGAPAPPANHPAPPAAPPDRGRRSPARARRPQPVRSRPAAPDRTAPRPTIRR